MNKNQALANLKEFYFPALVAFFILILSPLFLIPKARKISEMRKTITDQEKQISQLSQKLLDLQTLSEAELFETTNLLLEALPAQKDFYKILALTKKIFNDNRSSLKSFDFSPGKISSESGEPKKEISDSPPMALKILFAASYDNFGNLLDSFSRTLPLMEVDSIKFSSMAATSSANLPDLEGAINLKTYFAPLPKTMGRVDNPLPKISSQGKSLIEELKTYQWYQPEVTTAGEPVITGKENPFP